MNFLELAQTVDRVIGTQGEVVSIEVTGYHGLLAEHIRDSWVAIQNLRTEWGFMSEDTDIVLTTLKNEYTPFDIFAVADSPVKDWSFVLYDKAYLKRISYDDYLLEDWPNDPVTKPMKWATHPHNGSVYFNSVDKSYTVSAHYYKKPQVLVNNTDIIECPDEFLYTIIYKACASIGVYLGVPEIFQDYTVKANQEIGAMMRSYNPTKRIKLIGIV